MRKLVMLGTLMLPLMGGGYDSMPPQQQIAPAHKKHDGVDWTTVTVAICGMLGACVPAYFGYKMYKRK